MLSEFAGFFIPFNKDQVDVTKYLNEEDLLLSKVDFYSEDENLPTPKQYDIAVIGVPEERNSEEKGSRQAPDDIRKELYRLYSPSTVRLVDLGNLKEGKTINDTYAALYDIAYELLKKEMAIIILGGSKDLLVPVCRAYNKGKKLFSLCSVEPKFPLSDQSKIFNSETYLSEIVRKNKRLFNYSNIGYQTYYNSQKNINYINDHFEALRLGMSRTKMIFNEPYIRDSDIFSVDIRSIKKVDAPGVINPSVNGFYGEEICQLAKYAGLSDKVSTFALFNVNPGLDLSNQTTELSGQIIWHFIQSFYNRKNEYQTSVIKKFTKYIVNIESIGESIIFYKSSKSGRWWVEVNYIYKNEEKTKLISCNYEDYILATRNEIPERWWKFFKRYN